MKKKKKWFLIFMFINVNLFLAGAAAAADAGRSVLSYGRRQRRGAAGGAAAAGRQPPRMVRTRRGHGEKESLHTVLKLNVANDTGMFTFKNVDALFFARAAIKPI